MLFLSKRPHLCRVCLVSDPCQFWVTVSTHNLNLKFHHRNVILFRQNYLIFQNILRGNLLQLLLRHVDDATTRNLQDPANNWPFLECVLYCWSAVAESLGLFHLQTFHKSIQYFGSVEVPFLKSIVICFEKSIVILFEKSIPSFSFKIYLLILFWHGLILDD